MEIVMHIAVIRISVRDIYLRYKKSAYELGVCHSAIPVTLQSAGVRNIFTFLLWGAKHFSENVMGCETFFLIFHPNFLLFPLFAF